MGLTAILFPGQESQTPDMRDAVARVRPDLLLTGLAKRTLTDVERTLTDVELIHA